MSEHGEAHLDLSQSFVRTEALLGTATMRRLARSRVAIAGLGGVGGAIATTLARLGIGRFRVADPGRFDPPDLNRQWAATVETMDVNKAVAYERLITSINPNAEVEVLTEGVTEDRCAAFVDGADLLVEALDVQVQPSLRVKLASEARRQGIYNVLPPIVGFGTLMVIASPSGEPMERFLTFLERARLQGRLPPGLFKLMDTAVLSRMEQSMLGGVIPSTAAAASLVAAVVATEITCILSEPDAPGRRDPVCLPEVTVVDLLQRRIEVVGIDVLESAQA